MTTPERLLVVRILIGLLVAAGLAGCLPGSKCGGIHLGTGGGSPSYACSGAVPTPDAAPASDAGPPLECVVGESYCRVQLLDKVAGSTPLYSCQTLPNDGGLGVCSTTPTCACLCAHGVQCYTECSCSDTGGFAIITCHQI